MTRPADWTHDFFTGPWLEVQRGIRTPEQSAEEAAFVERALELAPGSTVLDVPCGDGRIAVELAARGHAVTGVDLVPDMLEDAKKKAAARGVDVELHRGDMRELPWTARFDAAFCWWGSFGWFDAETNLRQARAVARALRPGGRHLIDTHSLETLLPRLERSSWHKMGDVLLSEERDYDPVSGRVETLWTFRRGDETAVRRSSIHLYTYRELAALLEAAGFRGPRAFGSLAGEPFRQGSRRLYIVARLPN